MQCISDRDLACLIDPDHFEADEGVSVLGGATAPLERLQVAEPHSTAVALRAVRT